MGWVFKNVQVTPESKLAIKDLMINIQMKVQPYVLDFVKYMVKLVIL